MISVRSVCLSFCSLEWVTITHGALDLTMRPYPTHVQLIQLGAHCTGTSPTCYNLFNLGLTVHEPPLTHTNKMFKFVDYEAQTVGKQMVDIQLISLLLLVIRRISILPDKSLC